MRQTALAFLACALFGLPALADPITLHARVGSFSVTGTLLSFDGDYYRLASEDGVVSLRAAAVQCVGGACPAPGETTGFTIAAADSLVDVLVPALVRAFAAQNALSVDRPSDQDGAVFLLTGNGADTRRFSIKMRRMSTSEAFAELAAQTSDLAITDRSISEAEWTILKDAGLGDMTAPGRERLLALDGLSIVVSPRRETEDVSLGALAETLSTVTPSWHLLQDGATEPLSLTMRALAEDLPRLNLLLGQVSASVEYRVNGAGVAQAVRADPMRLGVLAASEAGASRALALREGCGLRHAPDTTQLATGRYPWMLPIKAYRPDVRASRDLEAFEAFLTSDAAAGVIRRAGFSRPIAQSVASDLAERALVALRLADASRLSELQTLVSVLSDAEQVGVSVPARSDLGPMRGLRRLALRELADGIASGALPADRLLLLASGPSPEEAASYAQALIAELNDAVPRLSAEQITVLPNGALLPVSCPNAPWADWMTARVDVWLLPATGSPEREN
ncbi:hypothetical protein [Tropicimonas sp. S265A]|uniref:hypothetical protein n=1 Tax=Tropicimonas sp. S265A TaxID=3415134 RepID=UPI003C7A9C9E